MAHVKIYVTRFCPYCFAAKRLLNKKGVAFEEIAVDGDEEKRRWLSEVTGQMTVPQIFIDEKPIGGYTELAGLDKLGQLDPLLA